MAKNGTNDNPVSVLQEINSLDQKYRQALRSKQQWATDWEKLQEKYKDLIQQRQREAQFDAELLKLRNQKQALENLIIESQAALARTTEKLKQEKREDAKSPDRHVLPLQGLRKATPVVAE